LAVKLRRGFKTEAQSYAVEYRGQLSLRASDPLDMFRLAEHLDVPVHPLSTLKAELSTECYRLMTESTKSPWSGVTLHFGHRKEIVYNDSHAPTRQQSDLAHELAHVILGHPASELMTESGGRHYNQELEEEAIYFSGILLVPHDAAIAVVYRDISIEVAAQIYNVSPSMMRMRINTSGARTIVDKARARRNFNSH